MFCTKFDQALHELRLAAGFLRNFQAAQRSKLDIDVAHLTRALANPLQDFQKLFLIAVAIGNELLKQCLETTGRGPKTMDALSVLVS